MDYSSNEKSTNPDSPTNWIDEKGKPQNYLRKILLMVDFNKLRCKVQKWEPNNCKWNVKTSFNLLLRAIFKVTTK